MSWGDVRGLLQYVPQFRGKVFVVIVDSPVPALAEMMLNLVSLQNIGVQLVIGSTIHKHDEILDRALEAELKCHHAVAELEYELQRDVCEALGRGQAIIIDLAAQDALSREIAVFAQTIAASKLILLKPCEQAQLAQGAVRATDLESIGDGQPAILLAAAEACKLGVSRVHILDGTDPAGIA